MHPLCKNIKIDNICTVCTHVFCDQTGPLGAVLVPMRLDHYLKRLFSMVESSFNGTDRRQRLTEICDRLFYEGGRYWSLCMYCVFG